MNLLYLIFFLGSSSVLGYDCDFEIPCDWEWLSQSGFGVATIANFTTTTTTLRGDADNNPNGHFLYYPMENGSFIDNITSPWFPNGSLTNCALEIWLHMYNMNKGSVKILIETNNNLTLEAGSFSGNNRTTWEKHIQTIGGMSKPLHILIEVSNPAEGIFPSHVAIDNIRFVHCLQKQLEATECNSHYFLCPEDVCIYRNQVCDISKDCPNGEDEQQDCNQIPASAYCDFEVDTCKWMGNKTHEKAVNGSWSRHKGPIPTRQDRSGLYFDHTYGNQSGHYMFPKFKPPYGFGNAHYLNSDIFHPPPIYHRSIHSAYYNSCQVRFFVYIHGGNPGTLTLNCVVLDSNYQNGQVIRLWESFGFVRGSWTRVVLPIPAIKHSFYLQFVATQGFTNNPSLAIDDISLSPECFGIGIPKNESDKIYDAKFSKNNTVRNKGYHFSTCGKKGTKGPTKQMCSDHYRGTNTEVNMKAEKMPMAGIQEWTVPHTGVYTVVARGAGGGRGMRNNKVSRGSVVRASFNWSEGEVIFILVGQQGIGPCISTEETCPRLRKKRDLKILKNVMKDLSNSDVGGGGGGGTFLFKKNPLNNRPMPLLIAGGGGGSSSELRQSGGVNPHGRGYNSSLLAGNGISSPKGAGGGGGWNDTISETSAGQSLLQGGYGGNICTQLQAVSRAQGGFGGGGGPCTSGGGGGGYRGGDAPISDNSYTNGQGGTSYVKEGALFPLVESGNNTGDGSVDIIPAQPGCGCQYLCIILDSEDSFHCICPEGQSLEKNGISCKVFSPTIDPKDSYYVSPQHVIMIVLSMAIAVVFIASSVYVGVTRYKKKQSRDMSHEPLNNAEVQLNRLRQGGGMVTEYNPNYEFGGSTCTIQDLPHVPRENLTLVKVLGQGAFGEVYRGYLTDRSSGTETPVAVKTLPELSSSQAEMDFLMEALILSKFNHPNIVRFIGVCFEKLPRFIVLELLPGGDLKTFLRESRPKPHKPSNLNMTDLLNVALDVAKGCQYLEENHFIHRDIAARNCLLTTKSSDRVVKIADFGMARDIYRADYYRKGGKAMLPVKWMPPEAFLDGIFTTKTDVWSFGVLLWEIMSLGYMPYPGWGNQEVMQLVTSGGRLDPPNNCPNQIYHIMMRCWHPIPEERPNFSTIIERLGYCLQDPDVIRAPLPIFHRPPSMERDATVMRPPDSENSCLQIQRHEILSPGSEDYLIPMPSSNYSLATDNTEIQSSPSLGSIDQLLELDESTTKRKGEAEHATKETNLSHPPFDKRGYKAVPTKETREGLSSSESLEALPVAPSVDSQSNLALNVEALQRQTANQPMRYINVDVNRDKPSSPAYDGVEGVNPVA